MFHNIEANNVNEHLERNQYHTEQKIEDIAILLYAEILPDAGFIIEKPVVNQQNRENKQHNLVNGHTHIEPDHHLVVLMRVRIIVVDLNYSTLLFKIFLLILNNLNWESTKDLTFCSKSSWESS